MLNFFVLVLSAFAAVNIWDVNDRLFVLVENLWQIVEVAARIEVVANVQLLQMLIAAELLVVSVRHRRKSPLIFRHQHGSSIATEVAACHGDQVCLVTLDQLSHEFA